LSQVDAAVNFTANFPDVPGPGIFSATENFTLDLLELDLELDWEDVAVTHGCIRTVAALSAGQGVVSAVSAAPGTAQVSCSSGSSSSVVAPMQLYSWAYEYAAAAAAGRLDGTSSTKAAAEGSAVPNAPYSSSRSSRVVAAAADGGMVAYCCTQQQQQGWGVYLTPGAPDAPVLHLISTRVIPAAAAADGSGTSVMLQLQCSNVDLQQHTLLVKQGRQLHTLPLLPAATAAAGCCCAKLPRHLLCQPGVLLLSLATLQYYVSGSQAVLLLPCNQQVADELNDM
jgi:hypothetical protein